MEFHYFALRMVLGGGLVFAALEVVVGDGFGGLLYGGVEGAESVADGEAEAVGVVVVVTARVARVTGVARFGNVDVGIFHEGVADACREGESLFFEERLSYVDAVVG